MADSKLSQVKEEVVSLKSRLKNVRRAAERGVDGAVSAATAVTIGGAIGLSIAYNDKNPGQIPEISDVPVSVVGAVLAYAMAMTTKPGKDGAPSTYQRVFESAGAAAAGIAACKYFEIKGEEWQKDDKDETKTDKGGSPMHRGGRVAGAFSDTVRYLDQRRAGEVPTSLSRLPASYVD